MDLKQEQKEDIFFSLSKIIAFRLMDSSRMANDACILWFNDGVTICQMYPDARTSDGWWYEGCVLRVADEGITK